MNENSSPEQELERLKAAIAEKDGFINECMASIQNASVAIANQQNVIAAQKAQLDTDRLYVEHFEDLLQVYGLLRDEKSKMVLRGKALWWMADTWQAKRDLIQKIMEPCTVVSADMSSYDAQGNRIPVMVDENQYYPAGLFTLGEDEVFLDTGAFTGDTALQFACMAKGKYKAIYALEPSKSNYKILKKTLAENGMDDRTVAFNCGLSNVEETLYFSTQADLGAAGTQEAGEGKEACEMKPIDKILTQEQLDAITYIKMDVEGDEMKGLQSLAKTIQAHKPRLAISVYHKQEDLYELPLYIHSLVPDYQFYLRHHTDIFGDTVLYALPPKA